MLCSLMIINPIGFKVEYITRELTIKREPDLTTFGDACLEAGGGFYEGLFWWHIEWPDAMKALTLKNLTVSRRYTLTNKLISINL